MDGDRAAELIAAFLDDAHAAARRREWDTVHELSGDILVLDREHREARVLQTLAERHVDLGHPDRDRRQETVLFADLVASTELATRFDPEILRRLIRRYELACAPVISALGGHVHRFVGDGILASFGYPTSHEDDARRAVQAGLDLVAAVASASMDDDDDEVGAELEVRVGIASGVLVHADRGAGSWTQAGDLFGPAVNLAARLHEVAAPGAVCISDDTASLVDGHFVLRPAGAHHLKGFADPVVVHRVVRRADPGRTPRHLSPFIGRQRELTRLAECWATVSDPVAPAGARRSVSVLVSGEAGVGKSRLLWELAAATQRSTIEIQCAAYRSESPLAPVRSAIERRCAFEDGDDDDVRVAKLAAALGATDADAALPYLAVLLGLQAPRPEVSPTQLREATLSSLVQWVVDLAARTPSVLVVEDVHWADPSTCELLERVVSTRPPGLLVVITSRGRPPWIRQLGVDELVVHPLSNADAHTLAAATTGGELPPSVVGDIAARSDGIPLFLEQLAASLTRSESRATSIPFKLAELLQARLDATGPSKRVAQLAATVGREFEPALLERIAERLQAQGKLEPFDRPLDAHLERLVESNLVEVDPRDERQLRFRHALVGEAAYESQLLEERPDRHGVLAELLLERGDGGQAVDPSVVAHHFVLAGRPVEAIGQYLAAAARSHAVGAFAEVATELGRAEQLLPELQEDLRRACELAIRMSRGLAVSSMGGYAAAGAVEDFARCVELCEVVGESVFASPDLVLAQMGLWSYYCTTGEFGVCESLSASMARQLARITVPAGRPSVLAFTGVEHFYGGRIEAAGRDLEAAVDLFDVDGIDLDVWPLPHDPHAAALAILGPVRFVLGDDAGARAAIDAGIERTRNLPFPLGPFSTAFVRNFDAWMHRLRGELDVALEAADEVTRLGDQYGFHVFQGTGRLHLAAARIALGPTADALDEMTRAIDFWHAAGGRLLAGLLVEQAWGFHAVGQDVEARSALADAEALSMTGQQFCQPEIHRLRAELAAATGADEATVSAELVAGLRWAVDQRSHLFVARCGEAHERYFGSTAPDAELRAAVEASRQRFADEVWTRATAVA